MGLSGIFAPILLSLVAGWRIWRFGPFMAAIAITGYLFSGNFVGPILALILYFVARKARDLFGFYFSSGVSDAEDTTAAEQVVEQVVPPKSDRAGG